MKDNRSRRTVRWLLSVALVALGLTTTWAWGQVARLAEPVDVEPEPVVTALFAAWPLQEGGPAQLHRSLDGGQSWQSLAERLPAGAGVRVLAADGADRVAVALADGSLLLSPDRGDTWQQAEWDVPVLSMVWDEAGSLYLGTSQQGVYRLAGSEPAQAMVAGEPDLAQASIVALAESGGRLLAATPNTVYYTDDDGRSWTASTPVGDWITTLAAVAPDMVYAGTATSGVYRTLDAGQTWEPAREGLGLAAGQMVHITALHADAREPGVLYTTVNHAVGSTEVHSTAAGSFVTLDGGETWQPLAGPTFPDAAQATALVVVPDRPLAVQAVTTEGLQAYEPDVAGALAAMESDDAAQRAQAARLLGLARAPQAPEALVAALSDMDPAVSLMAGEALARLDDPSTVSDLLVALEHPNERVRLVAAQTLGQMDVEAAVAPLRALLVQGSSTEATVAGQALGRIGNPEAVEALLVVLEEPVPTGRWHAAMAGLESAGEVAVDPLRERLDSRDVYVRRGAAEALGWIASPDATPALIDALNDRDETVRSQAAWSLGVIGDPEARTALERASRQDPAAGVREQAGQSLTRLQAEPVARGRGLSVDWTSLLRRLEPVRWLVLLGSLATAAWLWIGSRPPALLPERLRRR